MEEELWSVLQQQLEETGTEVDDAGREELRQLIEAAAMRMRAEGREDPASFNEAKESMTKLASALTASSAKVAPTGVEVVDRGTVRLALAGLCPIWPIC